MKTLLLWLLPIWAWSQVSWYEDFTDGNHHSNPSWQVVDGIFQVNAQDRLQTNDSTAGVSSILLPSEIALDAQWDLDVHLGFNPSSSNYGEVYFCADSSDLFKAQQAVYLQLGGTSEDRIALYIRTCGKDSLLFQSRTNYLDQSASHLKIQLKRTGNWWSLRCDSTATGHHFRLLDSAQLLYPHAARYFGLRAIYTKTRADKFEFDNLSAFGFPFRDTLAPELLAFDLQTPATLHLHFSEALDPAVVFWKNNYELSANSRVEEIEQDSALPSVYKLTLDPPLLNRQTYALQLKNLQDPWSNPLGDTTLPLFPNFPETGDLLINEIFPDPDPQVGYPPQALPEGEYLELYNTSSFAIDFKDMELWIGSKTHLLPKYSLESGAFVVLGRSEVLDAFADSVAFLPLAWSSSALSNSGAHIRLQSSTGDLLDEVYYDQSWYRGGQKADGGWALERISVNYPCSDASAFSASLNPIGGTPGVANSLPESALDYQSATVLEVALPTPSELVLWWNKTMNASDLQNMEVYSLQPALPIDSSVYRAEAKTVHLYFSEELRAGQVYALWMNLADCAGEPLMKDSLYFGLPEEPSAGDLFINELLFNPIAGGTDYIELWNASNKILDLERLVFRAADGPEAEWGEADAICEQSTLLLPGQYLCLTESWEKTDLGHALLPESKLLECQSLPSLGDEAGLLLLQKRNGESLDSVYFNKSFHNPILLELEGVSLERFRYDESSSEVCWTSASSASNYGTPGSANSQKLPNGAEQSELLSLPHGTLFSANGDGISDRLYIQLDFTKLGYQYSLDIYNADGFKVHSLVTSAIAGRQEQLFWEGGNDDNVLLPRGAYILLLRYFHPEGDSGSQKCTAVLTY